MPDPYQSPSNKVTFCTFGLPDAKSAGSFPKVGYTPE